MQLFYVNNDGGGFASTVEAEPGTTVGQFFKQKLPDQKPENYLIRVNRQITAADQVLQEGDRVSLTPTNITGALAA